MKSGRYGYCNALCLSGHPRERSEMSALVETRIFNQKDRLIEGWYWLLRSKDLKAGRTRAVSFMGRDLVVYRGENGKAFAMDAYCPHMGAHLAEGKVEGNEIRCMFHNWK